MYGRVHFFVKLLVHTVKGHKDPNTSLVFYKRLFKFSIVEFATYASHCSIFTAIKLKSDLKFKSIITVLFI